MCHFYASSEISERGGVSLHKEIWIKVSDRIQSSAPLLLYTLLLSAMWIKKKPASFQSFSQISYRCKHVIHNLKFLRRNFNLHKALHPHSRMIFIFAKYELFSEVIQTQSL